MVLSHETLIGMKIPVEVLNKASGNIDDKEPLPPVIQDYLRLLEDALEKNNELAVKVALTGLGREVFTNYPHFLAMPDDPHVKDEYHSRMIVEFALKHFGGNSEDSESLRNFAEVSKE